MEVRGLSSALPRLRVPFLEPPPPLATEEYDDLDDEFVDAESEQDVEEWSRDLLSAFEDCERALRLFFNNDVEGALSIMKPWADQSLYHSLGTAIFEFIPALLTFDQRQIASALAALKVCIAICNRHRRNYSLVESIGTMIKKTNYSSYTDLEAHAELCYAEALLLQAAMTMMEGEDLTALVRGTLKVNTCYNCYKECAKILEKKTWESEVSRVNFQSGVRLGLATFNVMISMLPPKIISVLEFVGFTGDKAYGLRELEAGSRAAGLRSVLCELTLLAYHLVLCHFVGAHGDLDLCQEILHKQLQVYPSGVWFLLLKGRHEFLLGSFDRALAAYESAAQSQNKWEQFRHFCFWEMMWVNCLQMSWREAVCFSDLLLQQSPWSRTIYSYTKASLLLQIGDDLEPRDYQHIQELMKAAQQYKQRIAGKSLPMEKFVIKRCARFAAQRGRLLLPAIELMCLWNMFSILANNLVAVTAMLKMIEATRGAMEAGKQQWEGGYEADNRALLMYLHGCCLAAMRLPGLALDALRPVPLLRTEIKEDSFLVPYSLVEMAMCHFHLGEEEKALSMLQIARKKYSGYSLESRLHFRIHSKLEYIKSRMRSGAN